MGSIGETRDSVSELISAFEAIAISFRRTKTKGKPLRVLPTPYQMFQVGTVLYDTHETASHQTLLKTYHSVLEQLPDSYLQDVIFHDLNLAFHGNASLEAVRSICGLYTDTPRACRAGFSVDLCKSIASVYDSLRQQETNRDRECTALLRTLSSLLLDGGILDKTGNDEEEVQLQSIMTVQALTEDGHNTCMGDLIEWQERTIPTQSIPAVVKSRFEETPQREYLLLMLQSAAKSSDRNQSTQISSGGRQVESTTTPSNKPVSAASEIHRRIQQVRDVLPELGEGYIEAALSCFQGDVNKTVAALLEGQSDPSTLPPVLQMMDPVLPARHTETTPDSYSLNDEEARRVTKARIAEIDRVQEEEAYALAVVGPSNEYDDDYDDQYDAFDGGEDLGGGDGESYDVDLDTMRTYNRAARQAEAEDAFWEENRNTNRPQKKDTKDGSEKKKYRGPDKGKGGRVIGPDGRYVPSKKGGKKAAKKAVSSEQTNDKPSSGDATSKIQKRRKNQNKAKVANHHRKERAQKKAAQGM